MSATREIIPPPAHTLDAAKTFSQPMSMVVRGGDFLFVSGLTAVDLQSGERVRSTTASETRQRENWIRTCCVPTPRHPSPRRSKPKVPRRP